MAIVQPMGNGQRAATAMGVGNDHNAAIASRAPRRRRARLMRMTMATTIFRVAAIHWQRHHRRR